MRWTIGAVVSAAALLAIVGCSSAPGATPTPAGATQPPGGGTQAPVVTQAPGGPTQAPVGVTGHECDAVPTLSLSNPNPASPPPDTQLTAHFPAQIDGQPVTDVQSMYWVYFLCAFGGQASVNQAMQEAQGGLNFATMSFGSATATVDGEEVELQAFRTPGTDSNAMVQYLALLAAQSGSTDIPGQVTSSNVGGRNVYVSTDSDGNTSYAYPSGDTLVFFDGVTESQAAKIIAALP